MNVTRRAFLAGCLAAGSMRAAPQLGAASDTPRSLAFPNPLVEWRGESSIAAATRTGQLRRQPRHDPSVCHAPLDWDTMGALLRSRHDDLRRHFIFEYYAWYGTSPYRHWDQWDRRPPDDLAAASVPLLGAYDSRSTKVIERHAAWMAQAGAGAINLSWWGVDSFSDRAVSRVMDVMRAHDIHVTFHLEPYRDDRAAYYVRDVLYLLRQYGERRRWDCFLLLKNANGSQGPVFKSFRTILARQLADCHGVIRVIPDYTPDSVWRVQTDALRQALRDDFDHLTLLGDSLETTRMQASGFDGIAIYDNFVEPPTWASYAAECTRRDLVFSFNTNPGYDEIPRRRVPPDSCYRPLPFVPDPGTLDWSNPRDRTRARRLGEGRIRDSLRTTLQLQTDRCFTNFQRGFFLVYINSFNEWHEGHQFEPMKDWAALLPAERVYQYHNAFEGDYRLRYLSDLLGSIYR